MSKRDDTTRIQPNNANPSGGVKRRSPVFRPRPQPLHRRITAATVAGLMLVDPVTVGRAMASPPERPVAPPAYVAAGQLAANAASVERLLGNIESLLASGTPEKDPRWAELSRRADGLREALADNRKALKDELVSQSQRWRNQAGYDRIKERREAAMEEIDARWNLAEKGLERLASLSGEHEGVVSRLWRKIRGEERPEAIRKALDSATKAVEGDRPQTSSDSPHRMETGEPRPDAEKTSGDSKQTRLLDQWHNGIRTALGWLLPEAEAAVPLSVALQALAALDPPGAADTQPSAGVAIDESIRAQAGMLNHSPYAIYHWVRENVEFALYDGSALGAPGTLRHRLGNDTDQALLLAALLRASGVPARIAHGTVLLSGSQLQRLIGTSDITAAARAFARAGIASRPHVSGGGVSGLEASHTWVTACVNITGDGGAFGSDTPKGSHWIDLDASLKGHAFTTGRAIDSELGFNPTALMDDVAESATLSDGDAMVANVDEPGIIAQVETWGGQVATYLDANALNLDSVFGFKRILEARASTLPAEAPFARMDTPVIQAGLDAEQIHTMRIRVAGLDATLEIPGLGDSPLILRWVPATAEDAQSLADLAGETDFPAYLVDVRPQLVRDGQVIAEGNATGLGRTVAAQAAFTGPSGSRTDNAVWRAGETASLSLNPQRMTQIDLDARLGRLNTVLANAGAPQGDATAALLDTLGAAAWSELDRLDGLTAGALGVRVSREPSLLTATAGLEVVEAFGLPVSARAGSLRLDMVRNVLVPTAVDASADRERQFVTASGLTASAVLHNVLDQAQENVSTAKALSSARALQTANLAGDRTFLINAANLVALRPQVGDLSNAGWTRIANATNAGRSCLVPESGTLMDGLTRSGAVCVDPLDGGVNYRLDDAVSTAALASIPVSPVSVLLDPAGAFGAGHPWRPMMGDAARWIDQSRTVLDRASAAFIPAVGAVNRWFADAGDGFTPLTLMASVIALSGPIGAVTARPLVQRFTTDTTVFSTHPDGTPKQVHLSAKTTKPGSDWTVEVVSAATETVVDTLTGTGDVIETDWDGTGQPDGDYRLELTASKGGLDSPKAVRTVRIDSTPPVVEITNPADASTLTVSSATVVGTASDGNLAEYVLDYRTENPQGDWVVIATGRSAIDGGTLGSWQLKSEPNGDYSLRLHATDAVGLAAETVNAVTLNDTAKDLVAPNVAFASPADGATVSGIQAVLLQASDDKAGVTLELFLDGKSLDRAESATDAAEISRDINTAQYANGSHLLRGVATDAKGNESTAEINVTFANGIYNVKATPNPFSPDGDGREDTTTLTADLATPQNWSIDIHEGSASGWIDRHFQGTGGAISVVWDGKDQLGQPINTVQSFTAVITTQGGDSAQLRLTFAPNLPPYTKIRYPVLNSDPASKIVHPSGTVTEKFNSIEVTGLVNITGWAVDFDFDSYTLEYRRHEPDPTKPQAAWSLIQLDSRAVENRVLGVFDTTTVRNDWYEIRLTARDQAGQTATDTAIVSVVGELKLGVFTLSQMDVNRSLSGLPLILARNYDTRERQVLGDFGYGWTMALNAIDLREDADRNVFITLPDGRRTSFDFDPSQSSVGALACVKATAWNPASGVHDTLKMAASTSNIFFPGELSDEQEAGATGSSADCNDPYLTSTEQSQCFAKQYFDNFNAARQGLDCNYDTPIFWADNPVLTGSAASLYQIPGYTLTDPNGIRYDIAKDAYTCPERDDGLDLLMSCRRNPHLTRISDPSGNYLQFNRAASGRVSSVAHSTGQAVALTRNGDGLVTAACLPDTGCTNYDYDAHKNLIRVTDPEGGVVEFDYASSEPGFRALTPADHYITAVRATDPNNPARVIPVSRNYYDDSGRLVRTCDGSDPTPHCVAIAYDPGAMTQVVTDRLGRPTVYEYDARGNVTAETNALGETTRRTYDADGNELTVTDPLGRTTAMSYDAKGNVTSTTDPLGNTTASKFDAQSNPLEESDALGHKTVFSYDAKKNPTRIADALGNVFNGSYDAAGNPLTITDPAGGVRRYTYNVFGQVTRGEDAVGNVIENTRMDQRGNVLEQNQPILDADGVPTVVTQTEEFDRNDQVTRSVDPLGAASLYTYNNNRDLLTETDANSRTVTHVYNSRFERIETRFPDGSLIRTDYNEDGEIAREWDAAGRAARTFAYDAASRPVTVTHADGSMRRMAYDAAGQLVRETDERGGTTTHRYDAAGRRTATIDPLGNVSRFEYDAADRMAARVDVRGRRWTMEYDATGRITRTVNPDGTSSVMAYDAAGRLLSKTDENGNTTAYEYDLAGRRTAVVDAEGHRTQYRHDGRGLMIEMTDASGHVTKFFHDAAGRLVRKRLPSGREWLYDHDALGNLIRETLPGGEKVEMDYDYLCGSASPVLAEKRHIGGPYGGKIVLYTYTDTCQLETITDDRGTERFEYDLRDRLTKRTQPDGATIEYTYDPNGNITQRKVTVGADVTTTQYGYDALNRLVSVTEDGVLVAEYSYDAVGNLTRQWLPVPQIESLYSHNSRNQLVSLVHKRGGDILARFDYRLDAAGNRLAVEDLGGRTEYQFDSTYKLVGEKRLGTNTYDIAYTYDGVGNRLAKVEGGIATSYSYDPDDRLEMAGSDTYVWDDAGRLLTGGGQTYAWDPEDRLRQIDTQAVSYSDSGLRESVGSEARVVDTLQGFGNVIAAGDDSFTWGTGLVKETLGGSNRWALTDALGSVRALADDTGAIIESRSYRAFGESTESVERFGFAGEEFDSGTGGYYLRQRYYDPTLGRFYSMDPVDGSSDRPLSHNDYAYAEGNPISNVDPSGTTTLMETQFVQNIQKELNRMHAVDRARLAKNLRNKVGSMIEHELYVTAMRGLFEGGEYVLDAVVSELGYAASLEFSVEPEQNYILGNFPGGKPDLLVKISANVGRGRFKHLFIIEVTSGWENKVQKQNQMRRYHSNRGKYVREKNAKTSTIVLYAPHWSRPNWNLINSGLIRFSNNPAGFVRNVGLGMIKDGNLKSLLGQR